MKRNFNGLKKVIAQAEDDAKKELINLERNKKVSLIDVFREDWDSINFLLSYFKKRYGSSYRHLAELFASKGMNVSESTLRTTYFRINAEKNKKRQASQNKEALPPLEVPVIEVQVADPGAVVVIPAPTTQDAHEVPPDSPVEINEELVESIDWHVECTRLYDIEANMPWNEEDQFIYCVLYWLANRYETTIYKFKNVSLDTHPRNMDVGRTAGLLTTRARLYGHPVDVPRRFASTTTTQDMTRVEAMLKG